MGRRSEEGENDQMTIKRTMGKYHDDSDDDIAICCTIG
jgi:hypothetical protein